jgi:ribonuclease VapC
VPAIEPPVVLDASAVLAWRDEHPGATRLVDSVLDGALLCAVNAAEVRYKAADTGDDPDELMADLVALGLEIVPFTDAEARHVPALRKIDRSAPRESGVRKRLLSLADLACLALARERLATAVTGDGRWVTLMEHGLDVAVVDYHSA